MTKRLLFLVLFAVAVAPLLRASPPVGAVVQGSHYDAAKQVVTFNLVNTSHKDISAYSMRVIVTRLDGTIGAWEYGGDFLPYMAETGGEGAFAPGASIAIDVPVGPEKIQTASATVDVVVYADGTADVLNAMVYKSIVTGRRGSMIGLQKANELLQNALADPNDPHPSVTVAAKLKALAQQYQTNHPKERRRRERACSLPLPTFQMLRNLQLDGVRKRMTGCGRLSKGNKNKSR